MKIRNGFVSNSSSSSYIVNVEGASMDDFCRNLYSEYRWYIFNIESFLKTVKRQKTKTENYIKDILEKGDEPDNSFSSMNEHFCKMYQTRLEELTKIETEIEKNSEDGKLNYDADPEDVIKMVLNYYGVKLTNTLNDGVQLEYFTSMHNSFTEGVSEILQEVILYCMFDTKYNVKCRRDSDNDIMEYNDIIGV